MKHTYYIDGMTCDGCRKHVEESLIALSGVQNVTIDLEKKEASIVMEHHIETSTFQEALDTKYTITEKSSKSSVLIQLRQHITIWELLQNQNCNNYNLYCSFSGISQLQRCCSILEDRIGMVQCLILWDCSLSCSVSLKFWI